MPRIPASHSPTYAHPSPCITLSPFSRHVSSPVPCHYGQFRLPLAPPTHAPHLSPGRSPGTVLQQSPLSTSCLSVDNYRRSNPPTLHHDASPDSAPLRLHTPPPRFQRADSSSSQSTGRLPSQSEDVLQLGGDKSCDATVSDDVGAGMDVGPETGATEEVPLPSITTPPFGRRGQSSSKVGPRGSLSTKTRTSPRKNIWTTQVWSVGITVMHGV